MSLSTCWTRSSLVDLSKSQTGVTSETRKAPKGKTSSWVILNRRGMAMAVLPVL